MSSNFTIEVDTSEVEAALDSVDMKMPNISLKMQMAVNREVVKKQKATYKSLHDPKNTSEYKGVKIPSILSNFHTGNCKDKSGTYIANRTYYARFIEKGANIKAHEDYLCFKINGEFKKVKSVAIPAEPFFYNVANEIWGSSKSEQIMNDKMQKELDKIWGK